MDFDFNFFVVQVHVCIRIFVKKTKTIEHWILGDSKFLYLFYIDVQPYCNSLDW